MRCTTPASTTLDDTAIIALVFVPIASIIASRYFHSIENLGNHGRTPGFRNHMVCRYRIRSNYHAKTYPADNYPRYCEGLVSGLVAGPVTLLMR